MKRALIKLILLNMRGARSIFSIFHRRVHKHLMLVQQHGHEGHQKSKKHAHLTHRPVHNILYTTCATVYYVCCITSLPKLNDKDFGRKICRVKLSIILHFYVCTCIYDIYRYYHADEYIDDRYIHRYTVLQLNLWH